MGLQSFYITSYNDCKAQVITTVELGFDERTHWKRYDVQSKYSKPTNLARESAYVYKSHNCIRIVI